jgi:hypothetical protein
MGLQDDPGHRTLYQKRVPYSMIGLRIRIDTFGSDEKSTDRRALA